LNKTGLIDSVDGNQFHNTADIEQLNKEFLDYLNFGGYPEAVVNKAIQADPARFIKADIVDKVLLRDLPSLYGIQDIQELNSLFTSLAYNTAGEVSLEELSKKSGVAKNTIKRYIEYLEAAFLVKIVQRIDRSGKRFQRANFFKVYLTNPSIRSALFSPVLADDPAIGGLTETAIYSQWFHSQSQPNYARWKGGEVDLVGLRGDRTPQWAVEVKWSDRPYENPAELLKNLLEFCNQNGLTRAVVTTKTAQGTKQIGDVSLEFVPSALYCHTVGANLLRFAPRAAETEQLPLPLRQPSGPGQP
jgi:predicted AAA+ superfamily ATPase